MNKPVKNLEENSQISRKLNMSRKNYLKNLLNNTSNPKFWKRFGFFSHQSQQIAFDVFEHKIESRVLTNDFFELYNIWVMQFFKRFDFPKVHHFVPRVVLSFHGFNGDFFTSFNVCGHVNQTVSPITNQA